MKRHEIRQRLAGSIYRMLYWGRNHVPPGLRSLLGIALMIGGILGFLPILGFWMLPVGVAFIALDVPRARHRIDAWMLHLAREGKLDRPGPTGPPAAPADAALADERERIDDPAPDPGPSPATKAAVDRCSSHRPNLIEADETPR